MVAEPGGARAAVRSVQVHDHEADVARAGSRAGVNLRGLDRDERAARLLAGGAGPARHAGRRFDAWITQLPGVTVAGRRPGAPAPRHRPVPGARRAARRARAAARGRRGAVVRLAADCTAEPHDRFILRSPRRWPYVTGGGEVLGHAGAPLARPASGTLAFLTALRDGDPRAAVCHLAVDLGADGRHARRPRTPDRAGARRPPPGFSPRPCAAASSRSLETGGACPAGPRPQAALVRRRHEGGAARRPARRAGERSAARPERPFSSAAELAAAVPALPLEEAGPLLELAAAGGWSPAAGATRPPARASSMTSRSASPAGCCGASPPSRSPRPRWRP